MEDEEESKEDALKNARLEIKFKHLGKRLSNRYAFIFLFALAPIYGLANCLLTADKRFPNPYEGTSGIVKLCELSSDSLKITQEMAFVNQGSERKPSDLRDGYSDLLGSELEEVSLNLAKLRRENSEVHNYNDWSTEQDAREDNALAMFGYLTLAASVAGPIVTRKRLKKLDAKERKELGAFDKVNA